MATRWLIKSDGTDLSIAGTIEVCELGDGQNPKEVYGKGGFTASTVLRVPWPDRYTVMNALAENRSVYPRAVGSECFCNGVSSVPAPGEMGGEPTHEELIVPTHALLTVNYGQGVMNDASEGGRGIFTESFEPNGRFQTIGHKNLKWKPVGGSLGPLLKQDQAPSIPLLSMDYVQTRFELTAIPVATLKPNHVNLASHLAYLLGITFPAETLLYVNSQCQRTMNSSGTSKWTMSSRFRFQYDGWNVFYNAELDEWCEIWKDVGPGGTPTRIKPFRTLTAPELASLIV